MQPALLSLVLVAVHVFGPVGCAPRTRDPEGLVGPQRGGFSSGPHEDPSAGSGRSYTELSGSKGVHRRFLVILPVRTDTSSFVSIFDLRRKRFLCVDPKGDLYASRRKDSGGCLFQHVSSRPHVLYPPGRAGLRPSSDLVQRVLGPLVKRQRRSDDVNPSDPLSQSHPQHPAKDHKDADVGQPDQDQAGAVSKETISSCDDPLKVLQPNGPVSPVKTNIADRAEQD